MRRAPGFTLIELLIVVAIIGILAAVAVPNFLNAQLRAKVSRVKADMRSYGTALESYFLDHHDFPPDETEASGHFKYLLYPCAFPLTTPIAYISDLSASDPFLGEHQAQQQGLDGGHSGSYYYFHYQQRLGTYFEKQCPAVYKRAVSLISMGPDHAGAGLNGLPGAVACPGAGFTGMKGVYASSNGTISKGEIGYFVGDIPVNGLYGG